ncbi:MAG: radical SAM protein [Bryobacteraceae bacterium]
MRSIRSLRHRIHDGLQYRLRSFAGGRWADHCRPVSIVFLMTERCNARCKHCDIWKNRGKEDSPSEEQYKLVLSDLRRWLGPVKVTLSGGEALLKPYTPELVRHASALGLFVEVLTHGYWEDQTRIEALALAKPWRVTVSLDGMGETHSKIRGREQFFETTMRTIATLQRLRKERGLDYAIRLKYVIMSHNLDDAAKVAQFATQEGMDAFYQPIEQNYNTPEDSHWYEHSENWPKDAAKAVDAVRELIELKEKGLHIANSRTRLEAMVPYFRDPDALRVATQSHSAHEKHPACAALTMLQVQANGAVVVCTGRPSVGDIKTDPIRRIWENRPKWWRNGCCMSDRCSPTETQELSLPNRP